MTSRFYHPFEVMMSHQLKVFSLSTWKWRVIFESILLSTGGALWRVTIVTPSQRPRLFFAWSLYNKYQGSRLTNCVSILLKPFKAKNTQIRAFINIKKPKIWSIDQQYLKESLKWLNMVHNSYYRVSNKALSTLFLVISHLLEHL